MEEPPIAPFSVLSKDGIVENHVVRVGGYKNVFAEPGTVEEGTGMSLGGEVLVDISAEEEMVVEWAELGHAYINSNDGSLQDLSIYGDNDGAIVFEMRVDEVPQERSFVASDCGYPCRGRAFLDKTFKQLEELEQLGNGAWNEVVIPLRCLIDERPMVPFTSSMIDTPFMIESNSAAKIALRNIRWETERGAEVLDCSDFREGALKVEGQELVLYEDALATDYQFSPYLIPVPAELEDADGGKFWQVVLSDESSVGIRYPLSLDMTAFGAPEATLEFDFLLDAELPEEADLLVKISSGWPVLSSIRLFAEVVTEVPPVGEWTSVSIPLGELFNKPNEFAEEFRVDITRVREAFQIEARGGEIAISFDNIRWQR